MKTLTAAQLAQILGATILAGDAEALAHAGVCTDTRRLVPGCVFFALRGENFDANAFAPQALAQGAAVVIVSEWMAKSTKVPSFSFLIPYSQCKS
jgi:UDP-N-acetylmuramoyl-tripeptide--D-alanyl-D-alanine ligase